MNRRSNHPDGQAPTRLHRVERFRVTDAAKAEQAFAIRKAVFVVEQGVPAELEYEYEEDAQHYLLFEGRRAIAAARWRTTQAGVKLERFAVLPNHRNRGVGAILLKAVLDDVLPLRHVVYLHAQQRAVPFYQRNGFHKVGDLFMEAGIPHFKMRHGSGLPDPAAADPNQQRAG